MTIVKIARERKKEDLIRIMHPLIKEWFFSKFKDFSLPQLYGVMNIWERKNTLISAPTGGTKTLTAFLSILNYLVDLASKDALENKIYATYLSPLKALSNDIAKNLMEPLEEIQELAKKKGIKLQEIRVALRTGDTSIKERAKMARKAPHIFITTPESLAIVLTTPKFIDYLKGVEFCIVDEIHAMDNKRGTYMSLTLERLNDISIIWPVKIGLSATIEPLEEVAKFLVGNDSDREVEIANIQFTKMLDIAVLTPVANLIEDKARTSDMYGLLNKLIKEHKTTLIFTNTRSATERVVDNLKERFPTEYGENIAAHHSSLSKTHRFDIEERLRDGKLQVVVCSTSLELGIDIGFIDLVIMLSSPKSSSRAMQRCLEYNSEILCGDGTYRKIGEIVKNKISIEIISYDEHKGFIKNRINIWHENPAEDLYEIETKTGEIIRATKEHPILTKTGWKKAKNINLEDEIGQIKGKVPFMSNEPYLYELVRKDKIFVKNEDNFFQKAVDLYRKNNKLNAKEFAELFEIPYSRFIDGRRLSGRRKSIRLDYFLKACEICEISKDTYLPYLQNLKTRGTKWPKLPLKLNEEIMWLAGIVATDGCIVKSKKENQAEYFKIKIGNKSKVMIEKIKEIVAKYDITPYVHFNEQKSFYNLEFGSNLFTYLFESLGIPFKNKSYEIKITNFVFSLPENLIYAYLEGIFEGDGNINITKGNNHGSIRIFSASQKFVLGIHRLFSRIGYENSLTKSLMKTSKIIKKVNGKYIYQITLSRKEDLRRFFESIPCFGEKAQRGLELTKKFEPYLSLNKNYNAHITFKKVSSIKFVENSSPVYNLTLEKEPNNFIIGNTIVHNCGRAGHRLHETIKARFIVLDRDDLVECAVIQKEIHEKKFDKVKFPKNCLDVLSQQIFGMAITKIWKSEDLFNLIRRSYCYSDLTKEDFTSVISYLSGEYEGDLEKTYVYAKIWYDPLTREIGKRGKLARVIYMTNIGTIPEESFVEVKLAPAGEHIGYIDEGFLERMKKGDVFVLGGSRYLYLYTRGMNLYVKSSVNRAPTIPSWFSEMLPLSFDTAGEVNRLRSLVKEKLEKGERKIEIVEFLKKHLYVDEMIADSVYHYYYEQFKVSEIPCANTITIEKYKGEKNYLLFNCMYGRRVNDALSRALAYLMGASSNRDIEIGISDNGFYFAGEKMPIDKALNELNPDNLKSILEEAINHTDVLARRFRHCASRALMILRNYKGQAKSVGKQQLRSHFILASVKKISRDFPILKEARREVLEDLMDIENTKKVLKAIKDNQIKVKIIESALPSPFTLNLILQGHSDLIRIEDKQEFLKRMHELHLKKISS